MSCSALKFVQGDTWEFDVTISDKDGIYELQDGDILWFTIKRSIEDEEYVMNINQTSTHFKITDTDIEAYEYYSFEIGIIFANGDERTLIQGRLNVLERLRTS